MGKPLKVFEHETIKTGQEKEGVTFKKKHFEALAKYNDKNESKYFIIGHQKIKFKQYVGVIQVGQLTIEILPKIDSLNEGDEALWQSVLFQMLKECHYIKMESFSEASLKYRYNSLLDLYFEEYLQEVNSLIRQGLSKKYRKREGNIYSLKGSINFPHHLSKNLIHKERFYTRHAVYDYEHLANQIIQKGLHVLDNINHNHAIADGIKRTLFNLPEYDPCHVDAKTFERIKLDRKTVRYKRALEIAKMLILNYAPDITGGSNDLLAILFDMNSLWEEYIYRKLKAVEGTTQRQNSQLFWSSESSKKNIRPDLKITDRKIVLDTKWKKFNKEKLDDGDLQQMYIYNNYVECEDAYLIYPGFETKKVLFGEYEKGKTRSHLVTVNPLGEKGLNNYIGVDILELLKSD